MIARDEPVEVLKDIRGENGHVGMPGEVDVRVGVEQVPPRPLPGLVGLGHQVAETRWIAEAGAGLKGGEEGGHGASLGVERKLIRPEHGVVLDAVVSRVDSVQDVGVGLQDDIQRAIPDGMDRQLVTGAVKLADNGLEFGNAEVRIPVAVSAGVLEGHGGHIAGTAVGEDFHPVDPELLPRRAHGRMVQVPAAQLVAAASVPRQIRAQPQAQAPGGFQGLQFVEHRFLDVELRRGRDPLRQSGVLGFVGGREEILPPEVVTMGVDEARHEGPPAQVDHKRLWTDLGQDGSVRANRSDRFALDVDGGGRRLGFVHRQEDPVVEDEVRSSRGLGGQGRGGGRRANGGLDKDRRRGVRGRQTTGRQEGGPHPDPGSTSRKFDDDGFQGLSPRDVSPASASPCSRACWMKACISSRRAK